MKQIYTGKTKNVFEMPDGNYLLKLKDDATGKDGVFDPGENAVGLSIFGLGLRSLKLSEYYFRMIEAAGIETHFVGCNYDEVSMTVRPAEKFGNGLEMICRLRAVGSFHKRYGDYIEFGAPLDSLVEITIKNDTRNDPPITKDTLVMLNIMSAEEFEHCKAMTVKATNVIRADLEKRGLELFDIKFEFGKFDGRIILIDEISGGNMRAYRKDEFIQPMELAEIVLGKE